MTEGSLCGSLLAILIVHQTTFSISNVGPGTIRVRRITPGGGSILMFAILFAILFVTGDRSSIVYIGVGILHYINLRLTLNVNTTIGSPQCLGTFNPKINPRIIPFVCFTNWDSITQGILIYGSH